MKWKQGSVSTYVKCLDKIVILLASSIGGGAIIICMMASSTNDKVAMVFIFKICFLKWWKLVTIGESTWNYGENWK